MLDRYNWINQSAHALAQALRGDVHVMHPQALAGGKGYVVRVDESDLDTDRMERGKLYLAVVYQGHSPDRSYASGESDREVTLKLHLEVLLSPDVRSSDAIRVWRELQTAIAAIEALLLDEVSDGTRFLGGIASTLVPGAATVTETPGPKHRHCCIDLPIRVQVALIG